MKNSSIFRALFLLNILLKGRFSRKEIIEEFKKVSIDVKGTSVSNYIKKLKENNINIIEQKDAKTLYYSLEKKVPELEITADNLWILSGIKQLLYAQKDYRYIKYTMELFYKVSKYIYTKDIRDEFLDFGYFSEINWGLVEVLEEHCANKDVIILDYLLPSGGNKFIQFHVDRIAISDLSNRMYLYGMLENGYDFFKLPIDRILMVKKVLRQRVQFNFNATIVKYRISTSAFNETKLEENESIVEQDEDFVTIQTPVVNEFHLVQRLLHFCPDLYYIQEGRIKDLVKEKLLILKAMYEKQTIDK